MAETIKDQDIQDWINAYLELCELIGKRIPEIIHKDLWYDQLMEEDYPYPEKCLFIEFNMDNIDSLGKNVQDLMTQISFIYAFDTLSDTYDQSVNQAIALEFGKTNRKIHSLLQSRSGKNFSALNRISIKREPSPQRCIAYRQTYTCIIRDYSALEETKEVDLAELNITPQVVHGDPPPPQDLAMFEIPT